jgi:colanic acid biosynthesis glycosyl transferase WcaI
MRIIVWGINYAPELTGIGPFNTGMCDFLRAHGHEVEMVTSFPYYPFWQKMAGDRGVLFRTEDLDGVRVHRCWHYVPRRVTTLRRVWHELSFGLTSFLRVLLLARGDIYLVVSPPLILGPLAAVIGWLKRRPYVFHVQDLQPDAAVGLGMVAPGRFTRLLYWIEAFSYRRAVVVSGISHAMITAFSRKAVSADKRYLLPNWVRWYGRNSGLVQAAAERIACGRRFREKFGISGEVFLATYSGNLGKKQGLDTLLDAAARLKTANASSATRRILILIVGDGVMRDELEAKIRILNLSEVRLMPLLVEADYHGMLAASQVGLILQAPGTGQYFLPSKLLSVLSMGLPVVTAADEDSELANAVAAGRFGVNVPTGDAKTLALTLGRLAAEPAELDLLRGRTAWVERFSGEKVLGEFEAKLGEIANGRV